MVHDLKSMIVRVGAADASMADEHMHLLAIHRQMNLAALRRQGRHPRSTQLDIARAHALERLLEEIEHLHGLSRSCGCDITSAGHKPLAVEPPKINRPQTRHLCARTPVWPPVWMPTISLLVEAVARHLLRVLAVRSDLGENLVAHARNVASREGRFTDHLTQEPNTLARHLRWTLQ